MSGAILKTIEMHTGGEPVRIVVEGYPDLGGGTILDKRRKALRDHDELRRVLMFEPRGHADMYGVIPVEPDHPDAAVGVLFTHNEGYSTMCGHATIAVARWAVDSGLVAAEEPETRFGLQVPAGLVEVAVDVRHGETGAARFTSVPAFAAHLDERIDVPGHGDVTIDVGYGGAFYAIADAADFGLAVRESPVQDLIAAAWATTQAAKQALPLHHPDSDDLAFLYGTILTDGVDDGGVSSNVCVFADRQVDRSPTGSGVTARMAIRHRRGSASVGDTHTFESIVGSRFTGRVVAEAAVGDLPAVEVEVSGQAHYTGESSFRLEDGDELPAFLIR